MNYNITEEGYRRLSAAIVMQAARDLYSYGKKLYFLESDIDKINFKHKHSYTSKEMLIQNTKRVYNDALSFLKSEELKKFTDIPSENIIKKVNELTIKAAYEEMATGKWPKKSILFEGGYIL